MAAKTDRILKTLAGNWQAEMNGFYTYGALARREPDAQRRAALQSLADAEKLHADQWAARIRELGGQPPAYRGSVTGDADTLSFRAGGDTLALRRLELDESRDIARYGQQMQQLGDKPSLEILRSVIADEREHHQTLTTLLRGHGKLPALTPEEAQQALDNLVAERDKGRRKPAAWIGDAVYGVNDGLGSIFGIVSGVSGATTGNSHFVLIAGLAGMVASALSMGSGAYLAAKSEREIYEAEYAREENAVALNEAEAREMLSLTYQARGMEADNAERFVEHIARDKKRLVDALARERMDVTEAGLRKPVTAALSGALSTAVGAFIPVVPFFFMNGIPAVIVAAIVSLLAHFAVGAAKSLITIRSWWSSGIEMTWIGALEGAVTYAIGIALGRIGGGGSGM